MVLKDIPQDNWTLERLSKYVSGLSKKWGGDGWLMGRALNIAYDKLHEDGQGHGKWLPWCREHCPELSKDTILRLRKVADKYPDPSKLDSKRLLATYIEAGILNEQERKTIAKERQSPIVNESPQESSTPPAAVAVEDEHPGDQSSAGGKTPPPPKVHKRGAPASEAEPTTKECLQHVLELARLMVGHLAHLGSRDEVMAAAKGLDGFDDTLANLHGGLGHLTALLTPRRKRAG
jgi:hypothetical protein